MTAFKAVVKVFAGEAKKIAEDKPTYRSPKGETQQAPLSADEITGEVFAYTVTGHSIEEVSRKAKAMFDANVDTADHFEVVESPRGAKG